MFHARIASAAAVGLVALSGVAVTNGSTGSAQGATTTPQSARSASTISVESAAYTASMKPYAMGNGSRSLAAISKAPSTYQSSVGTIAVSVGWSQLESTKGVYSTTAIDTALASAASNNLTVRLRVIAGTQAPVYVKKLGGAPIPFYDHQAKTSTTIGRFWRTDYQARWQALMTYLAAKYDASSIVREVNISGTGTISAEPMLTMGNDALPGSTITNNSRLVAAGATETARRAALMADIAFMQKTWAHTHTTLFCHPYVTLEPKPKTTLATTEAIITSAFNAAPGRTVFGHTGASSDTLQGTAHPQALQMYQFIIGRHYPFMAQTQAYSGGAKNAGVGDLAYVVTWLAAHGAYSTELPTGWQSDPGALKVLPGTTTTMIASATQGASGLSGA